MTNLCRLTVWRDDEQFVLHVPPGSNLRDVLLDHELSPYARYTEDLNCGGRGLCATCGVWVEEGPPAEQWHDRLAQRFGYPRLSCQITIEHDTAVRLATDKLVWGGRRPVPICDAQEVSVD